MPASKGKAARATDSSRVFFVEEPVWGPGATSLKVIRSPESVWVATPHIHVEGATQVTPDPPPGTRVAPELLMAIQRELLAALLTDHGVDDFVLWYYTHPRTGIGGAPPVEPGGLAGVSAARHVTPVV